MRHLRTRTGVVSLSTLLLVLVALGCAALVGARVTSGRTVEQTLGTTKVRDLRGAIVPLVTPGTPTVIMVSSRTCSWCKRALKDFGEMANGRAVSRLTLLTLEGAADGTPMLQRERLTGARLVGPVNNREETLLSLRFAGTPVFIAVDDKGRVVHTIPGYPIRPELERMFAVMVGDADVP